MKELLQKISKYGDELLKTHSEPRLIEEKNNNDPWGKNNHKAERSQYDYKNKSIEPGDKKKSRTTLFKLFIFLAVIIYAMVSFYRVPILKFMGGYLVVEQTLKKADVILCLSGAPIERGLATADLFAKGLASKIIITRGPQPDGLKHLEKMGINYQEPRDLLLNILRRHGAPDNSFILDDRIVTSTFSEATLVKGTIDKEHYKSIIIVTSPFHTRRAWLTFREVLENSKVDLMVYGSPYSDFSPEDWWKSRKYTKKVIIEYQKLLYYTLKYFL
jgi:uncharacterized SAM-binding protein YcdF (DUF218 family)